MTQKQKEQFNKAMAWRLGISEEQLLTFLNMTEEEKLNVIKEWKAFKQTQLSNLTEQTNTIKNEIV